MIFNENKVKNEKNFGTEDEQSTTLSNNNQHLKTNNNNLFEVIKKYVFKMSDDKTAEIEKANDETELKKSKNIKIEVNQINNEIVLKNAYLIGYFSYFVNIFYNVLFI